MEKAEIIMNFYLDIFGWHPLYKTNHHDILSNYSLIVKTNHHDILSNYSLIVKTNRHDILSNYSLIVKTNHHDILSNYSLIVKTHLKSDPITGLTFSESDLIKGGLLW
jgi:hypothetical protein